MPKDEFRRAHLRNQPEEGTGGQSQRERAKSERRRRLRDAARAEFLKRGYDAATTRDIAARADVAIGTLFVYAPEKRDLLFMILNDHLDASFEAASRGLSPEQPLMRQLIRFFRPLYEYFEKNADIGYYGLREILLFQNEPKADFGPEAARSFNRIKRFRAIWAELFEQLREEGRLNTSESGDTIVRALLWLHWGHIQAWLSETTPNAESGVAQLRRLFAMLIDGLGPKGQI